MLKSRYFISRAFILCAITVALALGATALAGVFKATFLDTFSHWMYIVFGLVFSITVITVLVRHKINCGFKYFWTHLVISNKLEKQLYKAGFYYQKKRYNITPKIKLSFEKDLSKGVLKIQNSIRFHSKLDDTVLSSALGKYIVENHYTTPDENYYVYELLDSNVSFSQIFNSYDQFKNYCRKIPEYNVFLDKRTVIPLQSSLFVGQTGSGKTYCLYSLILQMINKCFSPELWFNDPKDSSVATIGSIVAPERTATDTESIIRNLESFFDLMEKRKQKMSELKNLRLDSDYTSFNLTPYIFIIDEYASFSSVLATMEKKVRDKVRSMIYTIILQGREAGFFVFLVMQQSNSNLIDTMLRDNVTFKSLLGNAEKSTVVTTYGDGVKLPSRKFSIGEGVFTEPKIAPKPKLVNYPYLNFDILKALEGEQG